MLSSCRRRTGSLFAVAFLFNVSFGFLVFGGDSQTLENAALNAESANRKQSLSNADPQTTETPKFSEATPGVPGWDSLIADAIGQGTPERPVIVDVPKGVYLLDANSSPSENAYLSNTGAANPKKVGLVLRGLENAVVDFHDSELLTRGFLLPLIIEDCKNVVVKNFRIDSASPAMVQTQIVRNDDGGITLRPADWIGATIENGTVVFFSDGWRTSAAFGIAFDPATKHTLHNVADVGSNFDGATVDNDGIVVCPNWKDPRLTVGTILVLRPETYHLAGIFVNRCVNLAMENVRVHYAPAKAIVAQRCENLRFDSVSIELRNGNDDERFFTANADAIHCSCCKGTISIENGVYESMMDDAVNVHGIYVEATKQIDSRTIEIDYMHSQSSGFDWAVPGDEICFANARTMELFDGIATVESIRPVDQPTADGAKRFELTLRDPIPDGVRLDDRCVLENLTQTPTVIYRNNVIRNNRARGCLFSTIKPVLVEGNTFDHVSGTAILFCGDANGWFESGPCRDVVVRKNRFFQCMTAFYQFCEAPISIYPEIPDFDSQRKYYDGGRENAFLFEENVFDTFDSPILYARSTDGITFRDNTIRRNSDYPPIAPGKKPFVFDKANRVRIYDNKIDGGFDPNRDVEIRRSPVGGVRYSADEPFSAAANATPEEIASGRNARWFAYRSFYPEPETTRRFAELGVTTRCFYAANTINSAGRPYCRYPEIWTGDGVYDWAAYDRQVEDLLAASPDEKLICMVDLNTPYWLTRRFGYDSFAAITRAASDPAWFEATMKWAKAFLSYSEEKYGDKIVGYVLAAGGTSEWYEYDRGESSRVKNAAWLRWQKARNLDFGADVPPESSLHTAAFENVLYDPATEPEKIAYWRFHNETIVDATLRFAQTARELVPHKAIGFFFGYFLVNDPRLVSFGHLDYERLYASPDVDFFISPGNYSDRASGAGSGPQLVPGTLARFGKRYLHEIDHGTHVSPDWKVWFSQAEDEAGLKREIAYALTQDASLWIFDMWGGRFTERPTLDEIGRLKKIADELSGERPNERPGERSKSVAEVLMIVDPQSAYYLNEASPCGRLLAEGIQNKLNRLGTPYDIYSFDDLATLDLSRYKAIVFGGTFWIDGEREKILRERVCRDGRVVFWFFAPGICDGKSLDPTRCERWTGVARDSDGVCVKKFDDWTSVYCRDYQAATPTTFRTEMKKAGVWFYLDEEVPIFANDRLIAVHLKDGGAKTIRLPRKATKIVELCRGEIVAENVDSFDWNFDSPDTALFEIF